MIFNPYEHWDGFLQGEVAVNCETEELAEEFLKFCEMQGLTWNGGDKLTDNTKWHHYAQRACYFCTNERNVVYGGLNEVEDEQLVKFIGTTDENNDCQGDCSDCSLEPECNYTEADECVYCGNDDDCSDDELCFELDCLETGDLVQTRNGMWWFVFKDMANEIGENIMVYMDKNHSRRFMDLDDYDQDGIYSDNANYDIAKVASCNYSINFFMKSTTDEYVTSLSGFEVIWNIDQADCKNEDELRDLKSEIVTLEGSITESISKLISLQEELDMLQ